MRVPWIATSKTAMAITGDIVLDDYSLTFANGKSLDLEPYEADRVGNWSGSGGDVAGYVYKIDPPANPKLLNGNKLPEPRNLFGHLVAGRGRARRQCLFGHQSPNRHRRALRLLIHMKPPSGKDQGGEHGDWTF
jgi:hypothetical protein